MGQELRSITSDKAPAAMGPYSQAIVAGDLVFCAGQLGLDPATRQIASGDIKVQTARDHHVISTGPYAFVRHPMYSGVMLFFFGAPLLVGSWWGLALAPLFAVLFAVRAGIEERALVAGLPGYADYAARVRYRLLPGVW